jgi:hypothetical protein
MTSSGPHGLAGHARRLVQGTRLEAPARALARRARQVLYGTDPPEQSEGVPAGTASPPMFVEPGHFYSPVPSVADIEAYRRATAEAPPLWLEAIDLRIDAQGELLESFKLFYDEQPFPAVQGTDTRYWFENPSFGYADGLALYCMLRCLAPRRIIEVGSGWSSCVILDTCERFLDWGPQLTLIEPHPHDLRRLVRPSDFDRLRLFELPVQAVPLAEFTALEAGDVLFIDSTHVSRVGSDVNHEIFHILPKLQAGVYVHLHDIFFPFDYPLSWVEEGRAWNEAYLLRAFLSYNDAFEIVFFNDLVQRQFFARLHYDFPLWLGNITGSSIWLRKVG